MCWWDVKPYSINQASILRYPKCIAYAYYWTKHKKKNRKTVKNIQSVTKLAVYRFAA